jgi:hypothetical protein
MKTLLALVGKHEETPVLDKAHEAADQDFWDSTTELEATITGCGNGRIKRLREARIKHEINLGE